MARTANECATEMMATAGDNMHEEMYDMCTQSGVVTAKEQMEILIPSGVHLKLLSDTPRDPVTDTRVIHLQVSP